MSLSSRSAPHTPSLSPLAPPTFPAMPDIAGLRLSTTCAGIKQRTRDDLLLMALPRTATVAGVLTTSRITAAPVDWCRKILPRGCARGIVINSGNANAFTGSKGIRHVRETAKAAAGVLGCQPQDILVASTGVIGEPLPVERITGAMPMLSSALATGHWQQAARAIMTTDTFAKGASATAHVHGRRVTICGIAKGSGMIAPNLATMLAVVCTDAALPAALLRRLLKAAVAKSFHCITVDSDTSTNDTVLLAATAAVGNRAPSALSPLCAPSLRAFRQALHTVMTSLAVQVVRDGEGATKLVRIEVNGARSAASARRVGLAIGNSPLVKTALGGGDANWGRIVMAVGKCGEPVHRDAMHITIGGNLVAAHGQRAVQYDEQQISRHLQEKEIVIGVHLGAGRGTSCVWTCDFSHGYIHINADYRS